MGSSSDFNLNLEPSAEQSSPELSADEQSKNRLEEGDLMEVISRMYSDHKKMTKMVVEIVHNFSSLHSQLMQYLSTNTPENNPQIRKRKLPDSVEEDDDDDDGYTKMMSCSCINDGRLKMLNSKPKVSKALIRVDPSDSSLVVKDGYQWRKYGQKVTRDNPSPRAYFKCSFAPLCPVKKKVQKSAEDPTILVVLYEGEHTHKKPSTHEITPSCTIPSSSLINLSSSSHDISSSEHRIRHKDKPFEEENVDQHWLVERMASSLTKDPSFTSTLATLISDKVLEQTFY